MGYEVPSDERCWKKRALSADGFALPITISLFDVRTRRLLHSRDCKGGSRVRIFRLSSCAVKTQVSRGFAPCSMQGEDEAKVLGLDDVWQTSVPMLPEL